MIIWARFRYEVGTIRYCGHVSLDLKFRRLVTRRRRPHIPPATYLCVPSPTPHLRAIPQFRENVWAEQMDSGTAKDESRRRCRGQSHHSHPENAASSAHKRFHGTDTTTRRDSLTQSTSDGSAISSSDSSDIYSTGEGKRITFAVFGALPLEATDTDDEEDDDWNVDEICSGSASHDGSNSDGQPYENEEEEDLIQPTHECRAILEHDFAKLYLNESYTTEYDFEEGLEQDTRLRSMRASLITFSCRVTKVVLAFFCVLSVCTWLETL